MKSLQNKKAFTLIELLVVISIIAMLLGITSGVLPKVKVISKNLRQKAAFHAAEVSLELFSKDFGGYPDSSAVPGGDGTYVTGAQRLAEAFFGRDDRGFHPKSQWHPVLDDAAAAPGPDLYNADVTLEDRKSPYFERKRGGFYAIKDLWSNAGSSPIYLGEGNDPANPNKTDVSPVFTDVFEQNRITTVSGEIEKVGMPILYYKANPTARFRVDKLRNPIDPVTNASGLEYSQWTYNFADNYPLLQLPWLQNPAGYPDGLNVHFQEDPDNPVPDTNAQVFYEQITQGVDGNYYKPYNKNTFILISAGYDGIYGTKDDLTNFDY